MKNIWLSGMFSALTLSSSQAMASVTGDAGYVPSNDLTLWYLQPAESHGVSNAWMDYYLLLGNGQTANGTLLYMGSYIE